MENKSESNGEVIYDVLYRGWHLRVERENNLWMEEHLRPHNQIYAATYRAPHARKAVHHIKNFTDPESALKTVREMVDCNFDEQAAFAKHFAPPEALDAFLNSGKRPEIRPGPAPLHKSAGEQLSEMLAKHRFTHLRTFKLQSWGALAAYAGQGGRVFLIEHRDAGGFEVYKPITNSNSVAATLAALEDYLNK